MDVVRVRRAGVLAQFGPGPSVVAAPPLGRVEILTDGRERLAQREVEVHRSGAAAGGRPVGTAREGAVVDGGVAARVVGAHLNEPLGGAAVELDLVDRLPSAHLAQFGWAVRGEHDQRNARLPGLHNGGVEVGRGGARGAGHGHRPAARLSHPEGDKTGRALVEHGDRLDPLLRGQGERERRVARAGRGHRMPHSAAVQLFDEGLERRVGAVDRDHA